MNHIDRKTLTYALAFALLFVWSIPGTIALRSALVAGALVMGALSIRSSHARIVLPRAPLIALALLTAWLIVQAIFISRETAWALGELRGQWLAALFALSIGAMLGTLENKRPKADSDLLWTGIALVLASQTAIAVGQSVWHWAVHGALLRNVVPLTGGKLEMSYLVNILLAILTVDLYFRATERRPLLRMHVSASLCGVVLALFCNYLASSRNGIIGTVFLAFSALLLFLIDGRNKLGGKRTLAIALTLLVGMSVFAVASYQSDARWKTFAETAKISIDLDASRAWLDVEHVPLPLLSNGEPVEGSAYLRIAWLTAGVRLVADLPYGVGYGRNAFVRALKRQGYAARLGHAHSGFVDLLAGAGIPAVLLWLGFAATLIVAGWRSYAAQRNPLGLLLILLVGGFNGRMLIESVSRDHMLQIFFFLVGALLAACALPTSRQRSADAGHAARSATPT